MTDSTQQSDPTKLEKGNVNGAPAYRLHGYIIVAKQWIRKINQQVLCNGWFAEVHNGQDGTLVYESLDTCRTFAFNTCIEWILRKVEKDAKPKEN